MEINEFPPLQNTLILGRIPASQNGSFAKNLANPSASKEDFPVSFVRPSQKLVFKGEDLFEGISVWSFSLIGYSLGPRLYYERLLAAMKKVWILKGSFSLLSLADGFFLIKFSNQEDFDLVWSGGPWFMLGKPFILQKWSPKFQPKRDELSEIPLWIKIVDIPLALWTPKGISTIASYIGNPLSVDFLTAKRARLTYARVCVAISKDSSLPDEIPINIEGEDIMLKSNLNPEPVVRPPPKTKNRGRSLSRNPRSQNPAPMKPTPPEKVISAPAKPTSLKNVILESNNRNVNNFPKLIPAPEKEISPLIPNNCIGKDAIIPNLNYLGKDAIIPNLNSPIEETSSSGQPSIPSEIPPAKVMLSNKFSALQTDDPPDVELEDNGSVKACRELVRDNNLGLLCILEAKVHNESINDPWFVNSHMIFNTEDSINNFSHSNPGRIWIKWNPNIITFSPLFIASQIIHGTVTVGTQPPVLISVIYAANNVCDRNILWNQLRNLIPDPSMAWVIMGDFNCYRSVDEKSGGHHTHNSQLGELNKVIFDCGLLDLASVGLFYTWYNQRLDSPIHIKLDRMLTNNALLERFPDAFYKILPTHNSDHSPLILAVSKCDKNPSRFMFKNFWINMDGFWEMVLDAFDRHYNCSSIAAFYRSLQILKNSLKSKIWTSSCYLLDTMDNIKINQQKYIADLQQDPLNMHLNFLYKQSCDNLNSLSKAWSSWLYQRAKTKWLRNGKNDLGFLYAHIRSRKNLNVIKEITTSEGKFDNKAGIAEAIIKHFKEIFNSPRPVNENVFSIPVGNIIPSNMIESLTLPFTDLDIKNAVFNGSSCSAPGPDGYTFDFYKKAWHIIGHKLCNAIKSFFTTCQLPKGVKTSAVTLIPKKPHASNINDYRPISLCNVFYKIIAKLLANRLKSVLPLIIHESQAGFIHNRCTTDNILLASEVLREFNFNRNLFCAKLDIKKAFDTVSQKFLINRMRQKGFPDMFINWVNCCIANVHFSICLNGSLEWFFNSSSGLRQGCPLSPLLFCIVMDALSCSLTSNFVGNNSPVFNINGKNFNHLMYADDLLVFGMAKAQNATNLMNILTDFADSSGLSINPTKSSIIFSNNTFDTEQFCSIMGIIQRSSFLTYLGITISPERLNAYHFQINQRITGLFINSCIKDEVWALPDFLPDNMKHVICGIEIKEQPKLKVADLLIKKSIQVNQVFDYIDNQLFLSNWEKNFCWLTIGCTVYHLWRERNNRKFANNWNSMENITITIKNAIRGGSILFAVFVPVAVLVFVIAGLICLLVYVFGFCKVCLS
ncbi:uncharacterized protein LOC114580910 [Dendrobium catenatum]|uniref:uncharacterized protein LOC114580910 n=1 Tax=Dendrobium catenatum TaxID=906689 RepID=UPI00109FCE49|nr:uncharacterized protein LOC114580910 [Dendrobium catenatum]